MVTISSSIATDVRPKTRNLVYQLADKALRYGLRKLPPGRRAQRLALWWGYRYRPLPRTVELRSGANIHIEDVDYMQLLMYYLGTFEPHCVPYLRGCIQQGGTVVDVGANIGFYSLESATAAGPTGSVIAIEAMAPHVAALRRNVRLNGFDQVSVVHAAIGDSPGRAILRLPEGGNLGMFSVAPDAADGDEGFAVDVQTLDQVLANVKSIDIIKIDIEGSEYRALRGATETLRRFKPAVLIEVNEDALNRNGTSSLEVERFLQERGYGGWLLMEGGARAIEGGVKNAGTFGEWLFVHSTNEKLQKQLRLG